MALKAKLDVYPLENYVLAPVVVEDGKSGSQGGSGGAGGGKQGGANSNAADTEKRARRRTPIEKLLTLKARCREEQCVMSVEGVLMVHLHRHPHIILLKQQISKTNRDGTGHARVLPPSQVNVEACFSLPGGRCRRGEAEEMCLLRKLGRHLLNEARAPVKGSENSAAGSSGADTIVDVGVAHPTSNASSLFRVGEVLARWYRPQFSPLMYPYVPPHLSMTSMKEIRTVYLVHLEPLVYFNMVQPDVELVAVPLFDLYDNASKYGPIIASLPALLSRVLINYCSPEY